MLTREENELITRIGAGTPMGTTIRRYWMPALLAWELPEPDCPPVRVKLLGEDLVAFRDTEGHVGLLDELCPHRRASLFFGRNEECGLRCAYHGWKFDVSGRCVDMMNEPEDLTFKHKIRQPSYPTVELGGVIWAYMGPPELTPPPPRFAWTQSLATHRHVSKVIEECNWLQALEGGVDTSHAPILHRLITTNTKRPGLGLKDPFVRGKAPRLVVDLTDWGYQYVGLRPLDEADLHIRTYHFVMPFHQIRPYQTSKGFPGVAGHIWVPMDDENTMVYNWHYSTTEQPLDDEDRAERRSGNGPQHVDQKTFRSKANLSPRPERAEDGDVHRDRRHQRPGPRHPGKHGAHRRSQQGAPRTGRQGDHPGPPPAPRCNQDGSGGRHAAWSQAVVLHAPGFRRCAATRRRLARSPDSRDGDGRDPANGMR